MKTLLGLGIGVAAMALTGITPAGATPPAPDKVFDFSGTCTDCSGVAMAELTVLSSYNIGDTLTQDNFVSFHYDGTNFVPAFTVTSANFGFIGGSISAYPGFNAVTVCGTQTPSFVSRTDGTWDVGFNDTGTNGQWGTPGVPEPATWAMLLAGFTGLGLLGRRGVQRAPSAV